MFNKHVLYVSLTYSFNLNCDDDDVTRVHWLPCVNIWVRYP